MKLSVIASALVSAAWSIDFANALPVGFEDESVAKLQQQQRVTDLTFTPQGQLLVTQKKGVVSLLESSGGDYSFNVETVVLDITDKVCSNAEQGLVSVQVHPEFELNRYVYMYYTFNKEGVCGDNDSQGPVNRLSRFVMLESNVIDENSEQVFFETSRLKNNMHTGGKIEFGKDGYLYVTVGDGGFQSLAVSQDPQNLFGSMVRLTADGDIPPGNPFVQDANSVRCNENGEIPSGSGANAKCQELFAIGLRNPFRFAMNPNTEGNKVHFYVNDVGAHLWEEISEGGDDFVGANYGYPTREGPCALGETSNCEVGYQDFEHPIHYYLHTGEQGKSSAVTGAAFVPLGVWPSEYDGEYLFADFVEGEIYLMKDSGNEECIECVPPVSNKDITVFHTYDRIISMRFGPYSDGTVALYYTTRDSEVRRIVFGSLPDAVIDVTATAVEVGAEVGFSGLMSSDPDGNALSFEWDFDGDGVIDSSLLEDSFIYNAAGIYEADLSVRNAEGGVGRASVKINVIPPADDTVDPEGTAFELLPWRSGDDCPEGYDFCGILEFCQDSNDDEIYGYRFLCLEEECECVPTFAPLIRLVPGNKYLLTLRNAGSEVTNIHTHGLHIVGDGDSDDVLREVSGGGNCLDYTWDIAIDHPGGTYWYHAHHHGIAEKQVGGGAYGLLIVEDNKELNPVLPSWAENERLLQVVLTPEGLLGNGKRQEVINIAADQWYRLRVSIISTEAPLSNFTFADRGTCEVHKVAADGIWRSSVPGPKASSFEMTGVSRADFAIRCSTPGSLVPINFMDEFAATIRVGPSDPNFEMEDWLPNRPHALDDLSSMTVLERNKFSVSLGWDHVNNIKWDPSTAIATIGFDEVHEWTLVGTDFHPFHIHLYHMQVVTPGGCGMHEEGEFYDVISSSEDCTVRFMTADIGQRCVLHCHVLQHEDKGSMAWVNVTGPNMPRNLVQSMEYSCPKSSFTSPPTGPPTSSPTKSPTSTPTSTPTSVSATTAPTSAGNNFQATGGPATPAPTPTSSSAAVLSKRLYVLALILVNWCFV